MAESQISELLNLKTFTYLDHCAHHKMFHCYKSRQLVKYSSYSMGVPLLASKEVCNGGVACSLLKLGSLEKSVTASLFHSGLHSSSPFFVEKTTLHELLPS